MVKVPDSHDDTGYAVRYSDGSTEVVFAATAPSWFVAQLRHHDIDQVLEHPAALVEQLRRDGHSIQTSHFHTYCFGDDISLTEQPMIIHDDAESYSIVIDGRPVARAASSRSDDAAAELWIETHPAHRRRGYATAVAQAWATGVRQAGKIAFYSHHHDNVASASLARRLGLSPLFDIIAIELT